MLIISIFLPQYIVIFLLILTHELASQSVMKYMPIIIVTSTFLLKTWSIAQFINIRSQKLKISFADHYVDKPSSIGFLNPSSNVLDKSTYLVELFKTFNQSRISSLELQHIPNTDVLKNASFEDFSTLSSLFIRKSNVNSFPETLFKRLNNLQRLDISYNKLETLTSNMFGDLAELQELRLSHNQLIHLPNNVFKNLSRLKTMYVTFNKLSSLSEDVFAGLNKLRGLDLSHNRIINLKEEVFNSMANLMQLDLSFNDITFFNDRIFANLNKLVVLKMSQTFSATINSLLPSFFSNLGRLNLIEMNQNNFKFLPDNIFHKLLQLKELNLANNKLTSLNDFIFKQNTLLEVLKLQNNQLEYLSKNVFSSLSSLTDLNLDNNRLSVLDPQIFSEIINLMAISIANNRVNMSGPFENYSNLYNCSKIQLIYANNNIIPQIYEDWYVQDKHLEILDLRYNPIPQSQFHISLLSEESRIFLTSDNLMHLNFTNVQKLELNKHADESYILDKNKRCGSNCACIVETKYEDEKMVIHCKRFNESEIEEDLPDHLVTFSSTVYVEFILTNCNLTSLYPIKRLLNQLNVTKLTLSSNHLSSLDGLPELPKLEILEVHDNMLTHIDTKILEVLNRSVHLTIITLHNNPWNCDCSLLNFYEFVKSHQYEIVHANNITCFNKNNFPLLKFAVHEICPLFPFNFVIICGSVAILGLLTAVTISFYHKYKNEIKVWMFSHKFCKWLVTENEIDRDKKYDAFISYSHHDEWFVFEQLIPNLENGQHPYKLCVHYRDWLVGDHIPTQIYRSVSESRRTIVILSPNFLASNWARKEFQEAYLRAMDERCPRIIVIMLEEVGDTGLLDNELRAYISMNTYLKWSDPLFWKRLRFALPHKHGTKKKRNSDALLP